MSIKGVVLYYTMRCVASCAHCGVWSNPERRERMTVDQASSYLRKIADHSPLTVVVFVGGEPMLHADDICVLIRFAHTLGITTQLSTNAFWASSDERARRTLERLAAAGLDHLALSTDSYHAEFIDPRNVGRALRIAREFGLIRKLQVIRSAQNEEGPALLETLGLDPSEVIDHTLFKFHRHDPGFDARQYVILNRHMVTPFGRGAFLTGHAIMRSLDELEDVGCLMTRRFPLVHPSGDLYSCCCTAGFYREFLIGNLDHDSMTELEARMFGDPVFDALSRVGPVALAKALRDSGTDIGEGFANPCHACRHLLATVDRSTLVEHANQLVLIDTLFGDPAVRARFDEFV